MFTPLSRLVYFYLHYHYIQVQQEKQLRLQTNVRLVGGVSATVLLAE